MRFAGFMWRLTFWFYLAAIPICAIGWVLQLPVHVEITSWPTLAFLCIAVAHLASDLAEAFSKSADQKGSEPA